MSSKKTYSARLQVAIITFIILLVQILIFYVIFSSINVLEMLENSTYKYYEKRLEQGSKRLESKMVNKWASDRLMSPLFKELDYNYKLSREGGMSLELNEDISLALLETMNNANVSGSFIILNDDMLDENSSDEIFFLRDTNSDFLINENSDIVVEMGSAKLAGTIGITLSSSWSPYIPKKGSKLSDFKKIKELVIYAYEKSNIKKQDKLGFWMANMDLAGKGDKNIVYIEPIINKYTYELYGIFGVEVTDEMIANALELDSMQKDFAYGFTLLKDSDFNEESGSIESSVVYSFAEYVPFMLNKKEIKYTDLDKNIVYDVYDSNSSHIQYVGLEEDNFYGLKHLVKLYDNDSYYAGSDWDLLLIVDKNNFTYNRKKYSKGLNTTIVFSVVLALILAFVLSNILTKPVRKLAAEIEKINVNTDRIEFRDSRIREMNVLTEKIEYLSENIGSFYFKMQNLLEVIGYNIVIFEEDLESNTVNRIGRISPLLGELRTDEDLIGEYTKTELKKVLRAHLRDRKLKFEDIKFETGMRVIRVEELDSDEILYISYEKKLIDGKHLYIYSDYNKPYQDILAIEHDKNYDKLTSLINRNYFKKLVTDRLNKHPDRKYAMVMWDLDNLKYINDRFGHDWGDMYLKETAKGISVLRGENAYVSRFSGDEFFVFIEYDGNKENLRSKIARVHSNLLNSEIKTATLENIKIRASVGIAWYPEDGMTYAELHKFADFAMYRAKHTSKGSIIEFDRDVYDSEHIVISGKEDFNRLIEEKLVKFAFQPIVSTKDGEVFAYEALMRTTSEKIKSIAQVLKIAKMQFKLPQVEKLTFEVVLSELAAREDEFEGKKIFINSIANVLVPADRIEDTRKDLEKWGDKIVIEITEGEEIDNYSMDVKKNFRKEFGNMIAIDDFGAGYSSEKTLLKIQPDFIKIDMGIVRDIHKDDNKYQLVKNIIEYAKLRSIKTIAEGIESDGELKVLMELGADFIQGYYLAKPNFDIIDIAEERRAEMLAIRDEISRR